ncbi:MAG TPA: efflux RND transporter periplasmic adaptor subunit, partial [Longimicrobium sp.]
TAVAGGRVMPGMDLFRIAELSSVWIDGQVFEKDMGAIRLGQRARVTFEAYPGEAFDAVVRFVHPSVALESRTGRIRLALANPGGRLKPGMYARVELEAGDAREALVIPRSAVHTTGERSLVFVRQADGSLAHREVRPGRMAGSEVEVLAGLAAGEVVVASANFLIDAESSMGSAMGEVPDAAPAEAAPPGPRPAPSTSPVAPMPGPGAAAPADPHAGHPRR